jgi:hypothetical protein
MAHLAVKHLVDKVLVKQDPEGKSMANQAKRDEVSSKIVVSEESYARPVAPTDEDIVEKMNQPSDIDNALERNRKRLRQEIPMIPTPTPDFSTAGVATMPVGSQTAMGVPVPNVPVIAPGEPGVPSASVVTVDAPKTVNMTPTTTEQFDGLKMPSREEMLSYAKNTLKLEVTDKKTAAAFEKMTDEELYKELQMGE